MSTMIFGIQSVALLQARYGFMIHVLCQLLVETRGSPGLLELQLLQ